MNRKLVIGSALTSLVVGVAALGSGLTILYSAFTLSFTASEVIIGLVLAGFGAGSWAAGVGFMRSATPSPRK